jgi:hypothetical protein
MFPSRDNKLTRNIHISQRDYKNRVSCKFIISGRKHLFSLKFLTHTKDHEPYAWTGRNLVIRLFPTIGQKSSKTVIALEGKPISAYPFSLFLLSLGPTYEQDNF